MRHGAARFDYNAGMSRKAWMLTLVLGIAVGAYLSRGPWEVYREQQARANSAVREMQGAEQRRAELTRLEAKYRSSVGREELAREKGYVKPNERPYVQRP